MLRTSSDNHLDRREMIHGLVALFGAGTVAGCSNDDAAVRKVEAAFGNAFSKWERALLNRVADIIIPQTDTPGALAAGVTEKMELVLGSWMVPDAKESWLQGLSEVHSSLNKIENNLFLENKPGKQVASVKALDQKAFASNPSGQQSPFTAFRRLKNEIATAYYLSEVGATQELRYEQIPGEWRSCIPFSEVGRTWAV